MRNNVAAIYFSCVLCMGLISGCATKTASVSVTDKNNYMGELYRYIVWNGESYGVSAFIATARKQSVSRLVILNPGEDTTPCILSLAVEIGANVEPSNAALQYRPNRETCTIKRHLPKPALTEGLNYAYAKQGKVALVGTISEA